MYCPSNFIKIRKFIFKNEMQNRSNFTQDQLDLINFKRNNYDTGNFNY